MKKYISLLSIASAFLMQSCERSDSDVKITQQRNQNMKTLSHKKTVKTEETSTTSTSETDTEDEPKRDKQHWRIIKDTIL
jgi:hypothetical protein